MKFTVASAVNNDEILRSCLLASPELAGAGQLILERGNASASIAYNKAIAKAENNIIILVHQDMYFPAGWFEGLARTLEDLAKTDPQWGVLGIYGVTQGGEYHGNLYCNANQCLMGRPLSAPVEVGTVDEVVLILRKDSGLRFDEGLKDFHFYAADLCMMARRQGLKTYVVPGFCVHNANAYGMFPKSFWRGYLYLRRKYWNELPLRTPCMNIQPALWPMIKNALWRFCWLKVKNKPLARRVADPVELYHRIKSATVAPSVDVPTTSVH